MRWHDSTSFTHWSPRKIKEAQRKQKGLLRSAYAALKPGGVLVYCTCSFAPEENELVVDHLLAKTDAIIEDIDTELENTHPGLKTWGKRTLSQTLERTLRVLPAGPWDGFFIAKLSKPEQSR